MPSTLALAVLVVPLVTVFTGATGVSEPSSSLPACHCRISLMAGSDCVEELRRARWSGFTEEGEKVLYEATSELA